MEGFRFLKLNWSGFECVYLIRWFGRWVGSGDLGQVKRDFFLVDCFFNY